MVVLGARPGSCAGAEAVLRAEGPPLGVGEAREVRTWSLGLQQELPIELDPRKDWRLKLELKGCWAAPVEVAGSTRPVTVRFELKPLTRFRFRPTGMTAEELARSLEASFRMTPKLRELVQREGRGKFEHVVLCERREAALECEVPAVAIDLRLSLAGFAPIYIWNRAFMPGRTEDLGALRFQAGGSISGWVGIEVRNERSDTCTASALPSLRGAPSNRFLVQRESMQSTSDVARDGFFQVASLAAGEYELRIMCSSGGSATEQEIVVSAGTETFLTGLVSLAWPARVEAVITPPQSPSSRPWDVELIRDVSADGVIAESTVKRTAREDGGVDLGEVDPGRYALRVLQDASVWTEEPLVIEAGDGNRLVPIEIPVVQVEGTIRLGKAPIRAELMFGEQSVPRVGFVSDEEGAFEGFLPREGSWKVGVHLLGESGAGSDLRKIEVEVRSREGRPTRLEIVLPDTRVAGIVQTREGAPVNGARVSVWKQDGPGQRLLATGESDRDGRFLLRGLPEGAARVEAQTADGASSEATAIEIVEGSEAPPLVLIVERRQRLRGFVYSNGAAVVGASITIWPRALLTLNASRGGTDQAGRYEMLAGPGSVDFLVSAPGIGLKMGRVDLGPKAEAELDLVLSPVAGMLRLEIDAEKREPMTIRDALMTMVLIHAGAQLPLLELIPYAIQRDAENVLIFPLVEAGSYSLCSNAGACEETVVVAGGESSLVVRVR